MRDLKTEQDKLQAQFRLHLQSLKNNGYTDKEIAVMMGRGIDYADSVRKMRNDGATIHPCKMINLSKALIEKSLDSSIAKEMIPEGYSMFVFKAGATNGSILDELQKIMEISGDIARNSADCKTDVIETLNNNLMKELSTLIQELKRL